MFKEQVSLPVQIQTFFYLAPLAVSAIAIVGLFVLDAGLSRPRNVLHTLMQKLAAVGACAFGVSLIGYGIWNWQFYRAYAIPSPLKEAIGDWWLGGSAMTAFPQHLDPAVVPGADATQIFFGAFVLFAAFFGALLSSALLERVKTLSLSVISFIFGALTIPIIAYLVYGPVGPFSNSGMHEFAGGFFYLVVATWALVIAWRAGPRVTANGDPPLPHNVVFVVIGMMLIFAGLTGYVIANGYLIPDAGYFGIALSESGMGLVFVNVWVGLITSTIGGFLAWRLGNHIFYLFVAPIAGWISISAMADVVYPWQAGLVAFFAPLLVIVGARFVAALKIDEPKLVPLALFPSIYGILATALFASNVNQGGYFGLEGSYALGHAQISFGEQLLGVGIFLVGGLVSALILVFIVEKTIGLRDRRIDEGHADNLDAVVCGEDAYTHVSAEGAAEAGAPAVGTAGA
jgi:ammonia channel protein AmtB